MVFVLVVDSQVKNPMNVFDLKSLFKIVQNQQLFLSMHMKSDFQPLYKTDWIVCLQFKDSVPDRLQRLVLCVGGYLKTFMNTYIQVNRGGINCLGGKTLVLYDVKHVFVNSVNLITRALMQTRFSKHSYVLISEYFFVCSVDL